MPFRRRRPETDYLSKPIRRDQLAAVLARFAGEAPGPAEECGSALDQSAAAAEAIASGTAA